MKIVINFKLLIPALAFLIKIMNLLIISYFFSQKNKIQNVPLLIKNYAFSII